MKKRRTIAASEKENKEIKGRKILRKKGKSKKGG
jgi:hypothetical protein